MDYLLSLYFWFPGWAAEVAPNGDKRPKPDHFSGFMKRLATHLRAGAFLATWTRDQFKKYSPGADVEFLHNEIFIKGAKAVRGFTTRNRFPYLFPLPVPHPAKDVLSLVGWMDGEVGRSMIT